MKNLKFVFIILLILSFANKAKAQADSTMKDTITIKKEKLRMARFYISPSIGATINNYFGSIYGISFTYILSNNWGAKFSTKYYGQVAKDLPEDYRAGGFNLFGFKGKPKDNLVAFSLAVTKEFTTSSPFARFGLEVGFSIIEYKKAHFERQSSGGFFGRSNYSIEKTTKNSIGLHLRAKAELKLGSRTGIEVATIANINQFQSYFGGEIALNFGMLKRKIINN